MSEKTIYIGPERRKEDRRKLPPGDGYLRRSSKNRRQEALKGVIVGLTAEQMEDLSYIWKTSARRTKMEGYHVAFVATVDAENYREALALADKWAKDSKYMDIEAVTHYDRDNNGQRVVYLHPIQD